MPLRDSKSNQRTSAALKGAVTIAISIVICLYAFLQPQVNQRFGWNLPGLSDVEQSVDETHPGESNPSRSRRASESNSGSDVAPWIPKTQSNPYLDEGASETPADPVSEEKAAADGASTSRLRYGILREVRPQYFESPQGLMYVPGSAEGHRLEHLRRHTADQPKRPGKHGVFDGGMEGALRSIDLAYEQAQQNRRTRREIDRGRTIYTVQMSRRVGYVGGRDGNRNRRPTASRIKLVLEGRNVITAYPL